MNGTSDENDGQLPSLTLVIYLLTSLSLSHSLSNFFSYTVLELLPLRKDPPPPSKQDLSAVLLKVMGHPKIKDQKAPLVIVVRRGML
jgi:archaellum biogenesis ATPase FlaH